MEKNIEKTGRLNEFIELIILIFAVGNFIGGYHLFRVRQLRFA